LIVGVGVGVESGIGVDVELGVGIGVESGTGVDVEPGAGVRVDVGVGVGVGSVGFPEGDICANALWPTTPKTSNEEVRPNSLF
jgi:hypothetical protein